MIITLRFQSPLKVEVYGAIDCKEPALIEYSIPAINPQSANIAKAIAIYEQSVHSNGFTSACSELCIVPSLYWRHIGLYTNG